MPKNVVVIGTQWGDEGKGKIVDWLTNHAQGVVRFQGGHNAGHTLVVGHGNVQKIYKLNLVPSGIVHPHVNCYIGNGVVLDIPHLMQEIASLEAGGLDVRSRLKISLSCPLILGSHAKLDLAREQKNKIGTTGKGIGPCYEDKVARRALHAYDLLRPEQCADKLAQILDYHNFVLTHYWGASTALSFQAEFERIMQYQQALLPLLADVSSLLHMANEGGENLLFEGAQGALLDIDHGTYPFVTSSNCVAGQAAIGSGVGPQMLHEVLGITKAYATRVGGGPFPSELDIETSGTPGYQMSVQGHEIGTVTQRKRRCGWLDAVALRRSARVNGLTGLCITKLDVLDGLDKLNICTAYRLDGELIDHLPTDADTVAHCSPVYESIAGWQQNTSGMQQWDDLPLNARRYLERIVELTGINVSIISTAAARDATIVLRNPFNA
ncbi:MAG: adenylosuccinate synthase [Methylophilaceae bacterium]|nr:adenylosuccinate synthase [Methylophilaceae bacterium]